MKLDAPTIAAIIGGVNLLLGQILAYLAHRNTQQAKVLVARTQAPAPAPALAPLPAPSSGPLAAATAPAARYGPQ